MTGRQRRAAAILARLDLMKPDPSAPERFDRRIASAPSWRKGDPVMSPETADELAAEPAEDR